MALSPLLRSPRFVQWGVRIDTAPAWWWLAAQLATLALVWLRVTHQLPGLVVLAFLATLLWPLRDGLRAAPRLGWLALALVCTISTPLVHWLLSGPALALLASVALLSGLLAFLPARAVMTSGPALFGNTFQNRVLHKSVFAAAMGLCAAWAAVHA